ncbi:hypothetical protein DDZ18_12925 [Marinicauda salina]|uniref:Uncharacterized protein n=1 Tax=Marinicauda salina TaxID=2135793 RepID=A0A2U2BQN8_9PROT|nr:glycosyl hydrolase 108 family protein [Marinicauda salina]PWE16322.1 hypothetical protein DDZ18_12925 [Marinicauda salina]
MSAFEHALDHVLEWEGGFVDHPDDPGGATNMGITLRTLADWRGGDASVSDVRALTRDEAAAIYRARYWDAAHCGAMPAPIGFLTFDGAVNHGVGRAVKLLQRAVGVPDDGLVGPVTLGAANAADPGRIVEETAARRMAFYAGLSSFDTFGLGWSRRLMSALARAVRLAA